MIGEKLRYIRLLFAAALALFALASLVFAQSVVTPELMMQYQNRTGQGMSIPQGMSLPPGVTPDMLAAEAAKGGIMDIAKDGIRDTTDTLQFLEDTTLYYYGKELDMWEDILERGEVRSGRGKVRREKLYARASVYDIMFKGFDLLPDDILPFIQMYGYSTFAQRGDPGVKPGDMGSVPVDYPIKVGDEVRVHLWGRINQEYMLRVDRNGSINIPHVGPVNVAGLPFGTMQRTVTDKLKNIEGVNVSLSMGELRPIGVYIVGEVNRPGFHTVSPLTSVTNALFAAGGMSHRGSLRSVQLRRKDKLVTEIDYYEFLMSGNDKSGLRLQSGDVIVVPIVKQMAAVVGNVRRSALYELKGPTKLSEVLDLAGGVSPAAKTSRIQVERFEGNNKRIALDIEVNDPSGSDFMILDGDVVKVFPVLIKDGNVVILDGNVLHPGKFELKEGMRVKDLVNAGGGVLPESYFEYAVIVRRSPPTYLERVVTVNLDDALNDEASEHNMELQPGDKLVIYHRSFFIPRHSTVIYGAVNFPGTHNLMEGMTIRDLILQSGGLRDDASTERGELYRRVFDGEHVHTEKIEFNINEVMLGNEKHDHMLRRGDRVFIRNRKNWEPERRVKLSGQVVYPGTYMIFEGETLGELIDRAGGFRDDAYLPAAIFIRQSVKEREEMRMKQYLKDLEMGVMRLSIEMTSKGLPAAQLFEYQMRLASMYDSSMVMGRVMIDMTDEAHYRNFVLDHEDELFIPRDLSTVSVLGDVYNQGTFRFDERKPQVRHYLGNSGGPLESADRKSMYIIRANGTVVSNKTKAIINMELYPGDVVVVPTKIRYPNRWRMFMESTDATLKIASLITSIITLVIVLNTANKN